MAARLVSFSVRSLMKTFTTSSTTSPVCGYQRQRLVATGQFQNLIVEKHGKKQNVGVVKLNRPRAFNALNTALLTELTVALQELEKDEDIGCVVLTGSHRAFSVGSDLGELTQKTMSITEEDFSTRYSATSKFRKPIIAAVNGYALGGGCEIAMMCDIIYAGDNAQFGQPEIILALIPGAGGTQRLTHAVGKSVAMEMMLTGNRLSAQQAEQCGLVSKVFPAAQVLDAAVETAERIASQPRIAAMLCKEAVNAGHELPLGQGLRFERFLAYTTSTTDDQTEGMTAFVEKRKPHFTNK